MLSRRKATVEELKTVADDVRAVVRTATNDPKELARKQRRWRLLYGAVSAVSALVARRFAARSWTILTGERPPGRKR